VSSDARISTAFPSHPKTKKLRRRLGDSGPLACMYLFLWAAANRSDGDLSGMSDEDIELAVDWEGENGAFAKEMAAVGFLDGVEGSRKIHDWAEHNPWAAGADARSEKSRWAALCKQHGRREAARMMPEYAERLLDAPQSGASGSQNSASGTPDALPDGAIGVPVARSGSAPSPSPSPSPSSRASNSSLRSESSPQLALTGDQPPEPADLKQRKAQRIQRIAEDAQAAYNRILAKPTGLLTACTVLNKPRLQAVEKALPTVRAICRKLYGNERVTGDFWTALFETAAEDDFHSGRRRGGPGHENWQPDFEYLLRETVIAKLFDRAMTEAAA